MLCSPTSQWNREQWWRAWLYVQTSEISRHPIRYHLNRFKSTSPYQCWERLAQSSTNWTIHQLCPTSGASSAQRTNSERPWLCQNIIGWLWINRSIACHWTLTSRPKQLHCATNWSIHVYTTFTSHLQQLTLIWNIIFTTELHLSLLLRSLWRSLRQYLWLLTTFLPCIRPQH